MDPNTLNLHPDPGFRANLDPDPGLNLKILKEKSKIILEKKFLVKKVGTLYFLTTTYMNKMSPKQIFTKLSL